MKTKMIRIAMVLAFTLSAASFPAFAADTPLLTLRGDKRPEWLRRDGIVMAGSWEPLLFRVRRDGAEGYTPTAEQRAAYEREHGPEMVAKLKALGVNFVMMHCYKGGGLEAERESMADAVKFAKLCHDAGLRVGCYTYSGAFIWELFFKEMPQAKDWVVLNPDGTPVTYGKAGYRYYWNRNHPDAEAFYRKIVRFAVEDMRTDLVHFDNYVIGPGHDANSVARFRQYLRKTFPASLLKENGITDIGAITPPTDRACTNLLGRAWADFCSQSISDSFHSMTRYARKLRPDVLMETNPAGISPTIRWSVDHGRLLRGGEAFWDEGRHPGFVKDTLTTRIRTFKAARGLNNSAFVYTINTLEAAESMAFNLDCFGCICWFEYDQLWEYPGNERPMSPTLLPFVKFYHQRHDLLRDAKVVADVGVFRSHPSMQFGPRQTARLTGDVEDKLIANRCAFQLVFDQQLDELSRWPALIMPGCVALSDAQVKAIRRYVAKGGRLCIIGPLATHNEWMFPRKQPALDDLPQERVVRVDEKGDWLDAIRRTCGGQLSLSITCDSKALCAELTEQPTRRMVHLVNYRTDNPVKDIAVRVALPKGRTAKSVTLASPEHTADITVSFKQDAGFVTFTVPTVGVYEIAVVAME
ncbi:MAG: family 10 glycosylhydrolase [Verrucomicrobia bacterium]|nr:family 10 glycosylhydrolase [Verrucomicrobiota bacterium]